MSRQKPDGEGRAEHSGQGTARVEPREGRKECDYWEPARPQCHRSALTQRYSQGYFGGRGPGARGQGETLPPAPGGGGHIWPVKPRETPAPGGGLSCGVPGG